MDNKRKREMKMIAEFSNFERLSYIRTLTEDEDEAKFPMEKLMKRYGITLSQEEMNIFETMPTGLQNEEE